ncbi:MAG: glycosyltransferase family 2 protein [Candidatus Pacebacteria bacterium]|nr:glycosyltransferase family 2 protein [Candidatus Paceibacterota bacterium]
MKETIYLSVIIPAYNEEKLITSTISDIEQYLLQRKYSFEIIIVDDASTDNTVNLIESLKKKYNNISIISNERNQGKGYSIKKGMEIARGTLRLFMDADNSTEINHIDEFMKYVHEGYDVVIGNRKLKESKIKKRQFLYKEKLGDFGNILIRLFAVPEIKDTQCGFKLFSKKAVLKIFPRLTINRWGFDIETLLIANKNGLKIKSVPVSWENREETKVKLLDYIKTLKELFKIKINQINKKYDNRE